MNNGDTGDTPEAAAAEDESSERAQRLGQQPAGGDLEEESSCRKSNAGVLLGFALLGVYMECFGTALFLIGRQSSSRSNLWNSLGCLLLVLAAFLGYAVWRSGTDEVRRIHEGRIPSPRPGLAISAMVLGIFTTVTLLIPLSVALVLWLLSWLSDSAWPPF